MKWWDSDIYTLSHIDKFVNSRGIHYKTTNKRHNVITNPIMNTTIDKHCKIDNPGSKIIFHMFVSKAHKYIFDKNVLSS